MDNILWSHKALIFYITTLTFRAIIKAVCRVSVKDKKSGFFPVSPVERFCSDAIRGTKLLQPEDAIQTGHLAWKMEDFSPVASEHRL